MFTPAQRRSTATLATPSLPAGITACQSWGLTTYFIIRVIPLRPATHQATTTLLGRSGALCPPASARLCFKLALTSSTRYANTPRHELILIAFFLTLF